MLLWKSDTTREDRKPNYLLHVLEGIYVCCAEQAYGSTAFSSQGKNKSKFEQLLKL